MLNTSQLEIITQRWLEQHGLNVHPFEEWRITTMSNSQNYFSDELGVMLRLQKENHFIFFGDKGAGKSAYKQELQRRCEQGIANLKLAVDYDTFEDNIYFSVEQHLEVVLKKAATSLLHLILKQRERQPQLYQKWREMLSKMEKDPITQDFDIEFFIYILCNVEEYKRLKRYYHNSLEKIAPLTFEGLIFKLYDDRLWHKQIYSKLLLPVEHKRLGYLWAKEQTLKICNNDLEKELVDVIYLVESQIITLPPSKLWVHLRDDFARFVRQFNISCIYVLVDIPANISPKNYAQLANQLVGLMPQLTLNNQNKSGYFLKLFLPPQIKNDIRLDKFNDDFICSWTNDSLQKLLDKRLELCSSKGQKKQVDDLFKRKNDFRPIQTIFKIIVEREGKLTPCTVIKILHRMVELHLLRCYQVNKISRRINHLKFKDAINSYKQGELSC